MIRSFEGKSPKAHPSAFVSEAAYVVGDVEIGEMCSVWPGTIIRGNVHKIILAQWVNIQDNCVLHSDSEAYYGDHVTLGHHVICHARYVGDGTLIGNGAVVNGDAVIGNNCVIAAGAVILERAVIPPNTMVIGIPPNQQIRPANERQQQMGARTADAYARNGQKFKASGLEDPDRANFNYEGPIPSVPYEHPTFPQPE
ncbi:MAG: gamma carbonic anhydrase family protein [Chloroflexi bacterium]|nr:gamma carbonic anhydrase family protein [Chloroflexota bacterium]